MTRARTAAAAVALVVVTAACTADRERTASEPEVLSSPSPSSAAPRATTSGSTPTSPAPVRSPVPLRVETVVDGLDTVWALAFDPAGRLWWTERNGRLTPLGGRPREVAGVAESGEGGLMGLAFDDASRPHVMFTGEDDNRVVRLEGSRQVVLVDEIPKGEIHNGGRLLFGDRGELYVSTGDAGDGDLAQRTDSLAGKVLRVDPGGAVTTYSRGHRNIQGLCFDGAGRLLATEHGPDRGDEIAEITRDGDGGWPDDVGDGLRTYTPTIAPAGCAFYDAAAIPQWRGSLLFVTLKQRDLRRLTFDRTGAVTDEEILHDREFGRLRDVTVGPDGFVYLATSNQDGRGDGSADRILRIRPA